MKTKLTVAAAIVSSLLFCPALVSAQSPGQQVAAPVAPAPVHRAVATSERRGFMWGLSVGRGSIAIECAICDNVDPLTEALSLTAHAGWMLNSRLAVQVEHWTVRYNDRGSEWFNDSAEHLVAQRMTTLSGQLWLTKRLWIKAGAGVGHHISDSRYARVHDDGYRVDTATMRARTAGISEDTEPAGNYRPTMTGAIGFEFARRNDVGIDIQFRMGTTKRPDDEYQVHNTGIVFGVTWF